MNTQAPKWLVISVFLALLAGPPVIQAVAEARRGERPSALQVFTRSPTPANLRAYEGSLQEASVTANFLRPLMQAMRFFLLRDAGEKALVGPRGWLFYQPGVNYITGRARRGDSTIQDALTAVVHMRDELASRGIKLLVIPAPNKDSVFPDQLSSFSASPAQILSKETSDFLAGCNAAGVEALDLFAIYRAARLEPGESIYLEHDSHWTPRGAEAAALAAAGRIIERGWLPPGNEEYESRVVTVERRGDLVRMIRSPQIEALITPQAVEARQVFQRHTGKPAADQSGPELLVLGDSFLRIYQRDTPGSAGFVAQLARALRRRVAGIISDGGASTLVRQDLFRRPQLLAGARVVVWEFVERDIRLGTEGWQCIPLPPARGPRSGGRWE